MKNMENEFESKKTSLEKTYIEYTRDKEQEFISISLVSTYFLTFSTASVC